MRILAKLLSGLFYLIVLVVVMVVMWPLKERLANEVTVYPTEFIFGHWAYVNREAFRVFPETQTVVTWMPGMAGVKKLEDCVVRDRLNWECYQGDVFVRMNEGTFKHWLSESRVNERRVYLSRWRWYRMHSVFRNEDALPGPPPD